MPTYDYMCNSCNEKCSVFQNMHDNPLEKCKCGGKLSRLISGGSGMIFKGSGFYLTDYTDYGKSKDEKKDKPEKKDKKSNNLLEHVRKNSDTFSTIDASERMFQCKKIIKFWLLMIFLLHEL